MSHVWSFQEQCRVNDEMTVYGYVRRCQDGIDIPVDVINLCVKYYHIDTDQFDKEHVGFNHEISENGDTITHSGKAYKRSTSILTNAISDGLYTWRFKIIKSGAIMIGICRKDTSHKVHDQFFTGPGKGYGVMVTHGSKYILKAHEAREKVNIRCKDNDVITMCLDLTDLKLSYRLNDEDEVIAFKDIQKTTYCAAVYTYWENDCVTVVG